MEPTPTARNVAGPSATAADCLAGGGEMGALIRSIDWSQTPIGGMEAWSPALRMMVGFMLANRFPLLLWWGPDYIQLYNDAYRPIPGTKHPKSMGQPGHECWSEIWHILQPLVDTPFQGGPATWMEDILLEINRHGFVEETHFTIAYSPVPDDTAPRGIGGVLATVHEITEKVVAERRVEILRDLGARVGDAKTAEDAAAMAAETLAKHPQDVPFALLYLIDPNGRRAHLAGAAGVGSDEIFGPSVVDLDQDRAGAAGWPLAQAIRTGTMQVVEGLGSRLAAVPPGPWSDPPHTAVVSAIPSNKARQIAGLLVVGISSRLRLDNLYRSFLELMTTQIATVIANARAYEEERKRAEALAEIDRAKTLFFSNVSHEFRTPLTLMLGPLEDIVAMPGMPPAGLEAATVAHRNGLRLLKLVNTLLDFSRIEAGRAQACYEPTDLAAFTAELASNFRSACERAGVELVVDCPPLPEPIFVDRDMWEKILLNLVSNAFKFTFEGEIAVTLAGVDGAVELRVRDTGVGIPNSERPRIFERFHRVEGARGRTYEGSGIGLALVQELVKLHGGEVRVDSVLGQGTTFAVSVPLGCGHLPADRIGAARTRASTAVGASAFVEEALSWLPHAAAPGLAEAPPADIHPAPAGSAAPRPEGTAARILWADDNADMRDYVRRLLSGRYQVEAVADGEAALAAARANPPDLVLADVMMPRLDGFGLMRELRADPRTRGLPVVLLSARAGEESRVEGLEAGADDYLVKPFTARELLARVQTHLDLARIHREAAAREAELRAEAEFALETGRLGAWRLDLATGALTSSNRCKLNFGLRPEDELGYAGLLELIDPEDRDRVRRAVELAIADRNDYEIEYRVVGPDGRLRWHFARGRGVYGADGAPLGIGGVTLDITERKTAEEQRQLLIDELNHRVKNTLATVQSIATQTLQGAFSIDDEREAFQARLIALSKLHDLLTKEHWESAALREVILGALAPHGVGDSARFAVEGADLRLTPKAALALGMAVHELATNAAKYGALSNATGRVHVAWEVGRLAEIGRLRLRWRESGGPPVRPPRRQGFGSLMIQRGVSHDLGGEVRLRYEPGGIVCAMDIPLAAVRG